MKLNDVGISRLKKELNINSKSYVSIIATNKDDEMCKITHAPDISHILCGDTLIWSVNDIKQRDVQKKNSSIFKEFLSLKMVHLFGRKNKYRKADKKAWIYD